MEKIEEKLSIVIVTYNRAPYLERTLEQLTNSPFNHCDISILNNCSTDHTAEIAQKYCSQYKNITHIKHRFNIGGNANILRAIEFSTREYLWILADDDTYDFSDVDDVINEISKQAVDLIHVGAHTDTEWSFGGQKYSLKDVVANGYTYFRFASFIGCNIFKVKAFSEYLIQGYGNIVNSYPHMPFLLGCYELDKDIYISKKRIAKASVGRQNYDTNDLLAWWANTSNLLTEKSSSRICFFQQFYGNHVKVVGFWFKNRRNMKKETFNTIYSYLTLREKISFHLLKIPYILYISTRAKLRHKQ